jgi:hypothetical protein
MGALNLITTAKRKAAAALVREGVTVSLASNASTEKGPDVPCPVEWAMITATEVNAADRIGYPCIHGAGTTHLDSFAHRFFNGKMWNGYPVGGLVTLSDNSEPVKKSRSAGLSGLPGRANLKVCATSCRFLHRLRDLKTENCPMETINFTRGVPANESFPIPEVIEAARSVLTSSGAAVLQYGPALGYLPLREWLRPDAQHPPSTRREGRWHSNRGGWPRH